MLSQPEAKQGFVLRHCTTEVAPLSLCDQQNAEHGTVQVWCGAALLTIATPESECSFGFFGLREVLDYRITS